MFVLLVQSMQIHVLSVMDHYYYYSINLLDQWMNVIIQMESIAFCCCCCFRLVLLSLMILLRIFFFFFDHIAYDNDDKQ